MKNKLVNRIVKESFYKGGNLRHDLLLITDFV